MSDVEVCETNIGKDELIFEIDPIELTSARSSSLAENGDK